MDEDEMKCQVRVAANKIIGDSRMIRLPGHFQVTRPGDEGLWKEIQSWKIDGGKTSVKWCGCPISSRFRCDCQVKFYDGEHYMALDVRGQRNADSHSAEKKTFKHLKVKQTPVCKGFSPCIQESAAPRRKAPGLCGATRQAHRSNQNSSCATHYCQVWSRPHLGAARQLQNRNWFWNRSHCHEGPPRISPLPHRGAWRRGWCETLQEDVISLQKSNHGRWSTCHATYAGSCTNASTETTWKNKEEICPSSAPLGTFIGAFTETVLRQRDRNIKKVATYGH